MQERSTVELYDKQKYNARVEIDKNVLNTNNIYMLCSLLSLAWPIPWSNGRLYQCTTGGGIPDTLHVKVTVSPSFVIILPVDSSSSIFGGTVGKKNSNNEYKTLNKTNHLSKTSSSL